MISLHNLSIKNKLVLMQVFTAVIVLGVCVLVFVTSSIKGYKDRKATSAATIAQVIGANSVSSLEFLDDKAAQSGLANLRAEVDVVNAVILDKDRKVFATYTKPGWDPTFIFPAPSNQKEDLRFEKPYLFISNQIHSKNEVIGWICIRFELSGLRQIEKDTTRVAILLLLFGTGFAFLIAVVVQRYISKPLLKLVSVMQKVESTNDYKIRSKIEREDEIGTLAGSFDAMLSTIEKRDNEVAESRRQLDMKNLLLNSVIQNISDGLTVADKDGKIILSNEMGQKIMRSSIPKEKWAEDCGLFLPDGETLYRTKDIPLIKALDGESADAGEIFVKNDRIPAGMYVTASARPLKDKSGSVTGGVIVFHDITDQREAEMVIRNREQQLATIYDTVGDIIFVLKADENDRYQFISVNKTFLKVTGLQYEQVIGKWAHEVIPEASYAEVIKRYAECIRENKTISWEEVSEYPTGRLIGEVRVTPVFDERSRCMQLIGTVHDVTSQKKTETEIKSLNAELEKKVTERTARLAEANEQLEKTITQLNASVKEMESFSYSVSHDLRAPIRGINGYTSLLKKRYYDKFDEEGKSMVNMVVHEAVRMGQLIDDLLAFSRLGRKEIQRSMVDMTALANQSLEEVTKLAEVKYNAKTIIHDLPPILCDATLVQQVFINLIANALKFSASTPDPVVEIGSYSEDGTVVYYVRDNGVGFDMKYYNKLFGVFQRLHSAEEFPGTGIGLSIVQKIIERHGGRVWAVAKENEGATFYFALPTHPAPLVNESNVSTQSDHKITSNGSKNT